MTEYPAIAVQKTRHESLALHVHHYCAFGFAIVVMLAHIGLLGWSDIEVSPSYPGFVPEALRTGMQAEIQAGLRTGLQTGLHVAIAVMLIALASVMPHRGLRYLGAAFMVLAIGESAALLVPGGELAGAAPMWLHIGRNEGPNEELNAALHAGLNAAVTVGYLVLIALYVRCEDEHSARTDRRTAHRSVLAAIVTRRRDCVISIWLLALLTVQALAWSGQYSPGTWGMQLASVSSLTAELALLTAIMVSTVQHVRTQMQANRQLQVLAHTDSLTGLYNRRHLDTEIEQACQRARRHGAWLSVLMVDIDHFKLFNDTYGHLQGDDCLRRVAAALQRRQQRCDDAACRYGGEEFALILPACDLDAARGLAASLCQAVRALGIEHARSVRGRVTVSIGIAAVRVTGDQRGTDLLRLADDALYAAKRAGRDTVCAA